MQLVTSLAVVLLALSVCATPVAADQGTTTECEPTTTDDGMMGETTTEGWTTGRWVTNR
jgi:hypothetical protein